MTEAEALPRIAWRAPSDDPQRSEHTAAFAQVLADLDVSLAVTTYQAGQVIIVGAGDSGCVAEFRAFSSPMGVAASADMLAVATRGGVTLLRRRGDEYVPAGGYHTGNVHAHDLAFDASGQLWVVATRFSCVAKVPTSMAYSFVPAWTPPWITALAPDDRSHLSGLAMRGGAPRYVTMHGRSDEPGGWRASKATGGLIYDVALDDVVGAGLCMPHSPRWHDGRLYFCESGLGRLCSIDDGSQVVTHAELPGFARGLAIHGGIAFVGLSRVREHLFSELPITADGVRRECGVYAVDLASGNTAWLRFTGNVREVYDVAVLHAGASIPAPDRRAMLDSFVIPPALLDRVPGQYTKESP